MGANSVHVGTEHMKTKDDGLLQLPLISYHTQRRRRRRERALRRVVEVDDHYTSTEVDEEEERRSTVESARNRPHQYQRRHMSDAATQVAELFQGYGTHYVDLWMGSPEPQRQTVIVDTGSGVTAFPCVGCNDCGVPKFHSDGLFDQNRSVSFKKLGCSECLRGHCSSQVCQISMSYQEGSSWFAFEAQDNCYAGGLHASSVPADSGLNEDDLNPFLASKFTFPLKFGCQTRLTGLFITQLADGIMGLDKADASFVKQMHKAGIVPTESFSLCYSRQDIVDPDGTESGAFTLGGSDERLRKSPQVWTGGTGDRGFYRVKIKALYLRAGSGGPSAKATDSNAELIPVDISSLYGQVIVDSGTTDSYFSRSIAKSFMSAFQQLSGRTYGHRKEILTMEEINAMPTILIQLEGELGLNRAIRNSTDVPVVGLAEDVDPQNPYDVLLSVPASHYMEYDPDEQGWYNRFYVDEASGGVIGGNAMMGHDIFFDVENRRLGWAEADCDYTQLLKTYGFDKPNPRPKPNNSGSTDSPTMAPEKPGATSSPSSKPHDDTNVGDDDNVESEGNQFCATLTCRGALAFVVILFVGLSLWLFVSRRGKTDYSSYERAATNEVELKEGMSNGNGDYSDIPLSDDGPAEIFQDETGH